MEAPTASPKPPIPDAPAPEPTPTREKAEPREYIVLESQGSKEWGEVGRFETTGPDGAKEAAFSQLTDAGSEKIGALVAIAGRNWNPEEYEVDEKVVRRIKPKGSKK